MALYSVIYAKKGKFPYQIRSTIIKHFIGLTL